MSLSKCPFKYASEDYKDYRDMIYFRYTSDMIHEIFMIYSGLVA